MKSYRTLLFIMLAILIQTGLCTLGSTNEADDIKSFYDISELSDYIVTATVMPNDSLTEVQITAVLKKTNSLHVGERITVKINDDVNPFTPGDHVLLYLSLVEDEYRLTTDVDKPSKYEQSDEETLAINSVGLTPNPFNPATTITYTLSDASRVRLSIYSITGQKVATLVDSHMSPGTHSAIFDGRNLASGTYIYLFESQGFTTTGKMLLVK